MKLSVSVVIVGLALDLSAQNQTLGGASTLPLPVNSPPVIVSPYAVTQRGPHNRLWQQVTARTNSLGQTILRTNAYQELATGLCYWNGSQWADSSDQIQLSPNGASATNTQHQVTFAPNINTAGAIHLTTPDGQQMISQVMGLAYFDSDAGTNVLFAETQDSQGLILTNGNQVIYTNAFTNANCDILYSQKLAGFEQDIIVRAQLPSPASYGINGTNIWLQVWTEFTAAPTPLITQPVTNGDIFLDFGVMKMGRGKAFMLGGVSNAVPVFKDWVTSQGRTFLVESVRLNSIASKLAGLPASSGSSGNSNTNSGTGPQSAIRQSRPSLAALSSPRVNARNLRLPAPKTLKHSTGTIHLARADFNPTGLAIDYYTFNGGQTNFTFQSDTTYYVTNEVDLSGTTTFEGGTVIKYAPNNVATIVPALWVWNTASYRPAIFTAQDDDSVGQQISGSSGDPTGAYYGSIALNFNGATSPDLCNARFSFLSAAISGQMPVRNVQFVQCQYVVAADEGIGSINMYNVLVWNVDTLLGDDGELAGQDIIGENCTIDGCNTLYGDPTGAAIGWYNCILNSVNDPPGYGKTESYINTAVTSDSSIFQTVGAGAHYLADNTYRGQGTTSIDSTLLAELSQKTTWPPIVLSNALISSNVTLGPQAVRDTNAGPDLGYHYDPLDYIVDDFIVTNATLTVTNAAIACFDDIVGIWLRDGSSLVSIGTPLSPNWFTVYQMVQEQSVSIGSNGISPYYILPYTYGSVQPNGTFQFTKFSGGSSGMLYNGDPQSYSNLLVQECEFWAGGSTFYGSTNSGASTVLANNLFVRSLPNVEVLTGANLAFSNNLVWSATFHFYNYGACSAFNNIFDTCKIQPGSYSSSSNGYNAYLNTTNRITPTNTALNAFDIVTNTSLAYQSGPLGNFYQPSDSPLLYAGSTNASLVGLYEYTTQTNEVKEGTNMVSIGYHYVATDTDGNPDSTLWLGIPDYLVDTNGDGATDLVAWQLEYFGYTGLNPNADPFNEGTNLLQDYESGNILLSVSYTTAITNTYISTASTPITLTILGGLPYYVAVLIDNTNFSSANWTNFSSNLVVNVGTNQGWHDAWISVTAYSTNLPPAWQRVRLNLEYPPLLVLTNPIPGIVTRPVIQLQGYVSETLSNFTYDLSNAATVISNQPVMITGQFADTNSFAITTNYFQIYDLFLTNGPNVVTLHAIDAAGNVTTTNYTFTLDYSGDTNAPVITVTYPLSNNLIAATNFTLLGYLDDDTATLTVSNATFGPVSAVIERGGFFSVANIPLPSATNIFTLTAINAAGNSTNEQITVVESPLALTVDPLSTSQLNQPAFTVTGTISDPTQSVWVNGTQATVSGNSWSVTLNTPGSSSLQLVVEAGSTWGSSAGDVSLYIPMPPQVQITSFSENYSGSISTMCPGNDTSYSAFYLSSAAWTLGLGGYSSYSYDNWTGSGNGSANLSTNWPGGPWQYCSAQSDEEFDNPCVDPQFQNLQIQSQLELVAGGLAQSGVYQLIHILASVAPYSSIQVATGASSPGDVGPLIGSQIQLFGQMLTPTSTNAYVGEMWITNLAGSTIAMPYAAFDGSGNPLNDFSIGAQAEACQVVSLTVVSNAIQIGGTNNWGAIKTATNNWVYLQATLSITNNTNWANMLQWTGGEAVPGNPLQRRVTTTNSTNTTVTASLASSSQSLNVWIIWGNISYNFSGPLNQYDYSNFDQALPGSILPYPTNAGPAVGAFPFSGSGGAGIARYAIDQVEIIGTLTPTGIGTIASPAFTFSLNPQLLTKSIWNLTTNSLSSNTPPSINYSGPDSNVLEQATPINDQIFALDTPGIILANSSAIGIEGLAVNFTNYIYANGSNVSDAAYWYCHVRASFPGGNTVATNPCTAASTGSISPPLPTTWGDTNW